MVCGGSDASGAPGRPGPAGGLFHFKSGNVATGEGFEVKGLAAHVDADAVGVADFDGQGKLAFAQVGVLAGLEGAVDEGFAPGVVHADPGFFGGGEGDEGGVGGGRGVGRVVYRPRSSLWALARQFHLTGRWRREVIRRHPETASRRYLAPPAAVLGTGAGLGVGMTGVWLRRPWLAAMLVFPVLYLGFLVFATLTMRNVPAEARIRLPMVLATMHLAWGTGFLRGLPRRG